MQKISAFGKHFLFVFAALLAFSGADTFAQSLAIQGRVTTSAGVPITGPLVKFRVQILTPDSNACVLYDESQTLDLSTTSGLFSINLNNGTGTPNAPTSYTLEQAVSNFQSFAINSSNCLGGSGTVTYSPTYDANRQVRISFEDPSIMAAFETLPLFQLAPVARSMEATRIGGYPASSLLRVLDGTTPGTPAPFTSSQFGALQLLISGNSPNYMSSTAGSTSGAQLPTVSGNPSAPSSGSIWFDTSSGTIKFYNGSITQSVGTSSTNGTITGVVAGAGLGGGGTSGSVTLSLASSGVTAGTYGSASSVPVVTVDAFGRVTSASSAPVTGLLPTGTNGQLLKYSSGAWTGVMAGINDLYAPDNTPIVTNASCTAAQSLFLDSVDGHFKCQGIAIDASAITTGTLNSARLPDVATAGTYKSVTIDTKGRVLTGTNPTTLGGYGITDSVQNITGVPGISAGADASKPATPATGQIYIATDSFKIYRYDTGGAWDVISSAAGSGGTITGVTAGTGLTGGGTSGTVTVNLGNVGAAGTYTKVTTDAQGRVTSGTVLAATDIPALDWSKITTGLPTTVSGYGITNAVTNLAGTASITTDNTATKPTGHTAGRIYVDTASQKISYDDGTNWIDVASNTGSGFTGTLAGDVTGSQSATVVAKVGGVTAANVASGANAANAASSSNVPSTIVLRDPSGNFAAGTISQGYSVYRDSASNNVSIAAPSTVTATYGLTLPPAAPSANGQILSATTTGILSWVTAAAGTLTDVLSGTGITVSGTGATRTVSLTNTGTVGTYTKVVTDAQGRVSSGGTLAVSDIPALPWSQITSGTPTTVSGYGITNAVTNLAGSSSFTTDNTGTKPSGHTAGRFYVDTANQKISYDNGTAWIDVATGGGFSGSLAGDVTGSQSATTVALVGGSTAANVHAAELLANAATPLNTASAIVKRDASGNFAAGAVSQGSAVFRDSASNTATIAAPSTVSSSYSLTLPAAAPSANGQTLSATTGGVLSWVTAAAGTLTSITAGTGIGVTGSGATQTVTLANTAVTAGTYGSATQVPVYTVDAQGRITASSNTTITGVTPGGAAGGDLSGTYPNPTVAKINGQTLTAQAATAGQMLRYAGSNNWTPAFVSMADLRSTVTGAMALTTGCTASQTLTWNSGTDSLQCSSIGSLDAGAITTGTLAAARMPAFSGDASSSAGATVLTLAASGATAGTYKSVTVDTKGRVTAGTNPTTLGGFGITDAIQNITGVPAMSAGADASKPASPATGQIYIATDTFKIYRYNSSSWDVISSASGSGGTITGVTAGTGLTGGGTTGNVTLNMPATGTAGTYTKVTTDAYGRVTAGNTLAVSDIPSLPWSQITSGTPTTVSGYGITNAVTNLAGTSSFTTDNMGTKPTGHTAGRFYVDTANQKISYDNGTAWIDVGLASGFSGSLAGDVTGTQSATTVALVGGSTAANVHAAELLSNAATPLNTASAIVKRDASGNFAAGAVSHGSAIFRDSASNTATIAAPSTVSASYSLTLPAAAPSANGQTLSATTGGVLSWVTAAAGTLTSITAGTGIGVTGSGATQTVTLANTAVTAGTYGSATQVPVYTVDAQGRITASSNTTISGVSPGGAAGGDLSGTYPNPTVAKINGQTLTAQAATAGQMLRYAGSNNWTPGFVSMGDLRSTVTGAMALTTGCTASQTLTWNSGTDSLQCSSIGSLAASAITSGTLGVANGGTGDATLTAHGLLVGEGTSAVAATAVGAVNSVLIGNGASSDPSFSTAPTTLSHILAGSTSGLLTLKPAAATTSYTMTFPAAVAGAAGQVLTSDTSGNLSWTTPSTTATSYSGTLPIANGGTGTATAPTPYGVIYGSSATTMASTAAGTAGYPLVANSSAAPSFQQLGLATGVTGVLPVANGGTGSAAQNFVDLSTAQTIAGVKSFTSNAIFSGSVGIGTTAPNSKLDVTDGALFYDVGPNISSYANHGIILGTVAKATSPAGGQGSFIISSNDSTSPLQASISLITDPTGTNRRLAISNVEQSVGFRNITLAEAGGNVGIGTTAPTSLLQVAAGEAQVGTSGAACSATNAGAIRYSAAALSYCNGSAWAVLGSSSGSTSVTTVGTVTTGTWNASTITVPYGGTGATTLAAHGVLLGEGTSAVSATTAGVANSVLIGNGASSDPSFSTAPTTLSHILAGSTSGLLTLKPAATTTSYTMTFPAAVAGTAGQMLTSDTAGNLSWTTPSTTATAYSGTLPIANGGTGTATAPTPYGVIYGSSSTSMASTAAGTAGYPLVANSSAAPSFQQLSLTSGVTGVLPVANGGTGSTTQNYVDLSTAQTVAGVKTFSSNTIYNGSVGIGTTNPSYLLQLGSNSYAGNARIGFGSTGGGGYRTWSIGTNPGPSGGDPYFGLSFNDETAGATKMYISYLSGNVGIGTTAPAAPLSVVGTNTGASAIAQFTEPSMALGNGAEIEFGKTIGTYTAGTLGYVPNSTTSNSFTYLSNWGDAGGAGVGLVVKAGGNVGIGTTLPAGKLAVYGANANASTGTPLFKLTDTGTGNWLSFDNGAAANDYRLVTSGGNLELQTGGNSYQMVLNSSSGNVGIGLSSPSAALQVGSSGSDGRAKGIQLGDSSGYKYTFYQQTNASGNISNAAVLDANGDVDLRQTLGTNNGSGFLVFMTGAGTALGGTGASTEKMRIDRFGNVGIGTTSPGYTLEVAGTTANNSGAWTVRSDARLKRDIATLDDSLATVLKLRGVSFRWKDEKKDKSMGLQRGFIAQEVQKVVPEWVSTGNDGFLRLEKVGIEAFLVEAIKSFYQKFTDDSSAKGAQIQALEKNVKALEKEKENAQRELASVRSKAEKAEAESQAVRKENIAIKARLQKIEDALSRGALKQ